ncbi:hypothetical protein [Providencia sp. PROV124]|uniref:hypothetical protein n=1 Tax=Providencia sp. PROV124 TaxID=2949835 RepID=UPI00234B0D96|nr:hypothetical protein [Providencia sp. PROV124]
MPIKRTITLNFKTSDGKTLPASFDVSDGESAFEVWKKLPGNAAKTEAQFFAEQKGAQGAKGDKGDKGDRGAQGEKGATGGQGAAGAAGAQGASIVSVSVQVKENP